MPRNTRGDGSFEFEGLRDGSYALHYGDPASAVLAVRRIDFHGPRQILEASVAPPLQELSVRVTDEAGGSVPEALVAGTGSRGGSIRGHTDADGVIRATFLPMGRYRIVASKLAIGRGELDVVVGDEQPVVVDVLIRQ